MKIKISELKPNPHKKKINKGKLGKVQIKEISANLDNLGFMGAFPVVKIKDNYHLVNSHHRLEAMKKKFGNDYKVNITIHNYDNDQLLRGMVIENLSQRGSDFKEEIENIRTVEEYLNKNKEKLKEIRDSRTPSKFSNVDSRYKNGATARNT